MLTKTTKVILVASDGTIFDKKDTQEAEEYEKQLGIDTAIKDLRHKAYKLFHVDGEEMPSKKYQQMMWRIDEDLDLICLPAGKFPTVEDYRSVIDDLLDHLDESLRSANPILGKLLRTPEMVKLIKAYANLEKK